MGEEKKPGGMRFKIDTDDPTRALAILMHQFDKYMRPGIGAVKVTCRCGCGSWTKLVLRGEHNDPERDRELTAADD